MPLNAEGLKYEDVTLGDKTFRITEMPLQQADEWANACLFALVKGGLDIGNVNVDLIRNTVNPNDGELASRFKPKVCALNTKPPLKLPSAPATVCASVMSPKLKMLSA